MMIEILENVIFRTGDLILLSESFFSALSGDPGREIIHHLLFRVDQSPLVTSWYW